MSSVVRQESFTEGQGSMRRLKRYLPSDMDRVVQELRAIKGVTKKRAREFVTEVYDLSDEDAANLFNDTRPQLSEMVDSVCMTRLLDETIELCGICGGKKDEKCKSKPLPPCKPKRKKAKMCCPPPAKKPRKSACKPACKQASKPASKPACKPASKPAKSTCKPPCELEQSFSATSVVSAVSEI